MRFDVIGFGCVTVDDLVYVRIFPKPGQKTPVKRMIRQGGGLAGTAMVASARLGASSAYVGILGKDELSQFVIDEFRKENVDVSLIKYVDKAEPMHSIIQVEESTGERIILFYMDAVKDLTEADLPVDSIQNSRVVFIDHTVGATTEEIISLAHAKNVPVVADLESLRDERTLSIIPLVDHLIINLDFGKLVTGKADHHEIIRSLLEKGTKICVITDGENGCWYTNVGDEIFHQPAFQVKVVDTTGCGDVFHGAYAFGLVSGMAIPEIIKIASAAAAIKATQPGGRVGIPSMDKIRRFIKDVE